MNKANDWGGKRVGVGRPKLPPELKKNLRTIRLTDAEYIMVKEFVRDIREERVPCTPPVHDS